LVKVSLVADSVPNMTTTMFCSFLYYQY